MRRCDKCGKPSPKLIKDLVDTRMYNDIYMNYCESCYKKKLEEIISRFK